jgi:hypothetical protein
MGSICGKQQKKKKKNDVNIWWLGLVVEIPTLLKNTIKSKDSVEHKRRTGTVTIISLKGKRTIRRRRRSSSSSSSSSFSGSEMTTKIQKLG